jgi:hypothetical protein
MIYSLLTFFVLQFFFNNYWISTIGAFIVLVIANSNIEKQDCDCDTKKPQNDK